MEFCPLSIEWGSVADWASGFFTLAAVIVALIVAGRPARDAERDRKRDRAEEIERLAHIKAEAITVLGEIEAEARAYSQLVRLGGGDGSSPKKSLEAALADLRAQLIALQTLPNLDVRVFAELGRAVREARLPHDFVTHGSSSAGMIAGTLADKIAEARGRLVKVRGVKESREEAESGGVQTNS